MPSQRCHDTMEPHLVFVKGGKVVQFYYVLPLSAEEPVGVTLLRAVGL